MKNILVILLCIFSFSVHGQEAFDGHKWEAPYHLPIPKGWGIERFLIPISFAPQIPYKGVEDIRFTPGWANNKSDEYWAYAFLWYLDGEVKIDEKTIAGNLKNYYTGLYQVNTDSATRANTTTVPTVTSFKKTGSESYTGTIRMMDYMTRTPITLNCKVYYKYCIEEKKTIIFHELSPKPFDHNTWKSLHQLWSEFRCKKS